MGIVLPLRRRSHLKQPRPEDRAERSCYTPMPQDMADLSELTSRREGAEALHADPSYWPDDAPLL